MSLTRREILTQNLLTNEGVCQEFDQEILPLRRTYRPIGLPSSLHHPEGHDEYAREATQYPLTRGGRQKDSSTLGRRFSGGVLDAIK